MTADQGYSLYDQARLHAVPSDTSLRRRGFYAQELQQFLADYKDKRREFQSVYNPLDTTSLPIHNQDDVDMNSSDDTREKRINLSERLKKVKVQDTKDIPHRRTDSTQGSAKVRTEPLDGTEDG
eukprot:CAMPEP_0201511374 /NCGR_PEP_ID=MMETSP0161_2-20130828/3855_1 /ASSEMBLY_ACC=CAM_ASM_000251 /TAXON_ID=180227 /ORGANISM="Neoparamoeba aestuarina, Strain SoJaBio B1-5/56/2" /LENGTH=123 /DNA_ID=CAMNT_0047906849 /DNA_START=18 /DNA_END=385 /DNA_ORIENTATION=-